MGEGWEGVIPKDKKLYRIIFISCGSITPIPTFPHRGGRRRFCLVKVDLKRKEIPVLFAEPYLLIGNTHIIILQPGLAF
jgi:hypothetical protein